MKKLFFFIVVIVISKMAVAVIIYDTLYINKSPYQIANNFTFQACVFNDSANFNIQNSIIEIAQGDILQLHLINNDTLEHTFTIDHLITNSNTIPAGGTNDFTINFTTVGPYRFYSDKFYGERLGASSIIMYGYENDFKYYWNIFEQSDTLSQEIANLTATIVPQNYQPDIFLINMKVHPDLENDTHAKIIQNVGDEIYITLLNSGAMLHTFHFHGYHVEIINASINTQINGWVKDSFSVLQDETVLVKLVPDKIGVYPVHEHNLINITTNGVYPGGMLNLIEIQP